MMFFYINIQLQPPLAQNDTNASKRGCTVSYTTVQKFGLKNNNTSIQQGHVTLMKMIVKTCIILLVMLQLLIKSVLLNLLFIK